MASISSVAHQAKDLEAQGFVSWISRAQRVLHLRTQCETSTRLAWLLLEHEGGDPSVMSRSLDASLATLEDVVLDNDLYPLERLSLCRSPEQAQWWTATDVLRLMAVEDPVERLLRAFEQLVLLNPGRSGHPAWSVDANGEVDLGSSFRSFILFAESAHSTSDRRFLPFSHLLAMLPPHGHMELVDGASLPSISSMLAERSGHTVIPRPATRLLDVDPRSLLDAHTASSIARRYRDDFKLLGIDPPIGGSPMPLVLSDRATRLLMVSDGRLARLVQLDHSWRHRLRLDRSPLTSRIIRRALGITASS